MDDHVQVYNKCFLNSLSGPVNDILGKAYVKDIKTNAKLSVYFSKY